MIGQIIFYGGATTPPGYLSCDGALISRTTYSALFAVVGTTYGVGDGSTTFGLPDTRGRTLMGSGQGTGLSPRASGDVLGEEGHILTIAELAAHTHAEQASGNAAWYGMGEEPARLIASSLSDCLSPESTASAGSGAAHNNIQPSLVALAIIQYMPLSTEGLLGVDPVQWQALLDVLGLPIA